MSLSQYVSGVSASGMLVGFTPAQLKTWSMRWNLASVAATKDCTWGVEDTSMACVWVGVGQEEARGARAEALMSQIEREAPREESLRAVARLGGGVSSGDCG